VGKFKKQAHTKEINSSRKATLGDQTQPAEADGLGTVVVDRRGQDRRKPMERRHQNTPVALERRKTERRKVPRRRQIDPTTCERDYSEEEIEFMSAMDVYKRTSGRMFPTCSEVLEVLRGLGYQKRPTPPEVPAPMTADASVATLDPVSPTDSATNPA
jgi:hypothetical protein